MTPSQRIVAQILADYLRPQITEWQKKQRAAKEAVKVQAIEDSQPALAQVLEQEDNPV